MANIGVTIDEELQKLVQKRCKSLDLHQGQYIRALLRHDIIQNKQTLELHETDLATEIED